MNAAADVLALLDKHCPQPSTVARVGLTSARVRELMAKAAPIPLPTPQEARRGLARLVRAARVNRLGRVGAWGYNGLPEHVWRAMWAEYCTGKSCREVAAIFGGSRQSVHEVLKNRGLKLRPRHLRLHVKIEYRGRFYTPSKNGYYRATDGDRPALHHRIWEAARGPIPEGWQVAFLNADPTDFRLENMECLPIADVTRLHQTRLRTIRENAA